IVPALLFPQHQSDGNEKARQLHRARPTLWNRADGDEAGAGMEPACRIRYQRPMLTLFHHSFCPHSRFVRLPLGQKLLPVRRIEERTWERRNDFLIITPAGTTPVLVDEGQPPIPGAAIIAEYLDETYGEQFPDRRLLPTDPGDRIEVRRLMSWFN